MHAATPHCWMREAHDRHVGQRASIIQDRVEQIGVVDVVDDDRTTLCRDPSGKPAADRDPHALLDFLFDPFRRPCDELVRRLVEQENRTGVGIQQIPNACQQFVEQIFEREVRERSVGHGLQPRQYVRRCGLSPGTGRAHGQRIVLVSRVTS